MKFRYSKLLVELVSSSTPGMFDVTVRRPGEKGDGEKSHVRFQELLQTQYDGAQTIDIMGLKLNVDELIYVLNHKFLS
jgi:hypothetical protein